MSRLIRAIVFAALAAGIHLATAAPLCQPSSPAAVRIGVTFKPDGSAAGAWAYWWCVANGKVTAEWRAAPASTFTPSLIAQLRAYSSGTSPDLLNTPTTLPANAPELAAMRVDINAVMLADTGKPVISPEVWKAIGTGTVYVLVNGIRTGVVAGRKATVGVTLDCTTRVVSGSWTYCAVAGGAPNEVTLGKKVTP